MALPVCASTGDGGSVFDIIDAVGGWFSGLFDAIGKAVTALLDGIMRLFIPHKDYFPKVLERLRDAFGVKFGGLFSSIDHLRGRFSDLRPYRDAGNFFTLQFPQGHLFGGSRVNLLSGASGVLGMIRGAVTGFLVLWTASFAYRKVTALVNT